MTFVFEPQGGACDLVVTIRGAPGAPTEDDAFRARVARSVAQNLDDYLPAMEREIG